MKKTSEWILPILLICNFILFLKEYISTGNINYTLLCIVFALTPIAAKNRIKFSNSKHYTYLSIIMCVLAALMLILQSIKTM